MKRISIYLCGILVFISLSLSTAGTQTYSELPTDYHIKMLIQQGNETRRIMDQRSEVISKEMLELQQAIITIAESVAQIKQIVKELQ